MQSVFQFLDAYYMCFKEIMEIILDYVDKSDFLIRLVG